MVTGPALTQIVNKSTGADHCIVTEKGVWRDNLAPGTVNTVINSTSEIILPASAVNTILTRIKLSKNLELRRRSDNKPWRISGEMLLLKMKPLKSINLVLKILEIARKLKKPEL